MTRLDEIEARHTGHASYCLDDIDSSKSCTCDYADVRYLLDRVRTLTEALDTIVTPEVVAFIRDWDSQPRASGDSIEIAPRHRLSDYRVVLAALRGDDHE